MAKQKSKTMIKLCKYPSCMYGIIDHTITKRSFSGDLIYSLSMGICEKNQSSCSGTMCALFENRYE